MLALCWPLQLAVNVAGRIYSVSSDGSTLSPIGCTDEGSRAPVPSVVRLRGHRFVRARNDTLVLEDNLRQDVAR